MNSTRLLSLRAGLGPAGDGYGLEHMPAISIPKDAELVSCRIVPTRRSRAQSTTPLPLRTTAGMVCLAMISTLDAPPADHASKQSDAAGGPAARSSGPSGGIPATSSPTSRGVQPPAGGLLYVYPMRGEKKFEVERALQRQPQQLALPFIPAGMTHATVWRDLTASNDAETASSSSRYNHGRIEKGDALLVWDRGGDVYGYTRWEGFIPDGDGHCRDGKGCGGVTLTAESQEGLFQLIPELASVGNTVLNLCTLAMDEGGATRWRQVMAGCVDGVYHASFDAINCRAASSFLNGPVSAVSFKSWPLRNVRDQLDTDDAPAEYEVVGFACGEMGTMASLVTSHTGKTQNISWVTADEACVDCADEVTCMGCADFCRDGSHAVAIGTRNGKVIIYASAPPVVRENSEANTSQIDAGFGATCWEEDDSASESPHEQAEDVRPTMHSSERNHHACDQSVLNAPTIPGLSSRAEWQRDMPHSVWGITLEDFNHDGIDEMVVATQFGLHMFRPDYRDEATRLAKTLDMLQMLQPNRAVPADEGSEDGVETAVSLLGVEVHEVGHSITSNARVF